MKKEQLLRLNVSIYIIISELRTEQFEFACEDAMFIRRKGSTSGKVPKMSHGDCFFVMFSVIIIVFVTWKLDIGEYKLKYR